MSGTNRHIHRLVEIRTYFCFSNAYRNITTIKYKKYYYILFKIIVDLDSTMGL